MFCNTINLFVASPFRQHVAKYFINAKSFNRSWCWIIPKSRAKVHLQRVHVNLYNRQALKSTCRQQSFNTSGGSERRSSIIPSFALGFAGFTFFSKEKEEKEEEEEDPLIILLKYAKLYELRHDIPLASDYYHKALALLLEREEEGEWTDEQVLEGKVYIYDGMANAAFAMFKLDEAEKLYKETMKGLLQQKEKDDNAIIEISLKLATIYTIERRFEEAKGGYTFCIDLLDKKLKSIDRDTIRIDDADDDSGHLNTLALLGMCTTSYGRFLIVRNKYNEAYEVLTKALIIAKQVFGEDDNQVAVLYNDLATVASHKNDSFTAKDHALSAIKVGRTAESDDLPMFYCNLCYICLDLQEWEQGRKSGRTALRMAKNKEEKEIEQQAQNCLQEIKESMKKV